MKNSKYIYRSWMIIKISLVILISFIILIGEQSYSHQCGKQQGRGFAGKHSDYPFL